MGQALAGRGCVSLSLGTEEEPQLLWNNYTLLLFRDPKEFRIFVFPVLKRFISKSLQTSAETLFGAGVMWQQLFAVTCTAKTLLPSDRLEGIPGSHWCAGTPMHISQVLKGWFTCEDGCSRANLKPEPSKPEHTLIWQGRGHSKQWCSKQWRPACRAGDHQKGFPLELWISL